MCVFLIFVSLIFRDLTRNLIVLLYKKKIWYKCEFNRGAYQPQILFLSLHQSLLFFIIKQFFFTKKNFFILFELLAYETGTIAANELDVFENRQTLSVKSISTRLGSSIRPYRNISLVRVIFNLKLRLSSGCLNRNIRPRSSC